MKLLFKVTLFYLLITLVVFGAGGIITYNIFKNQIQLETDRFLIEKLHQIQKNVDEGEEINNIKDTKIKFIKTRHLQSNVDQRNISFSDTLVYHSYLKRMEVNRKLTTYYTNENQNYRIEIHDVIVETDDIFQSVYESQTRLFIILGIVFVISGFLISSWLFRPFEDTLVNIKNFNIKNLSPFSFKKTSTKEFNILNDFISVMIEKINKDYKNLKEFTENASHELQTPLAIAKGKLELLLQYENLDEKQIELIKSAYDSISHMSQLNHSLTLLAKIENKEFSDKQTINLSNEIEQLLNDLSELSGLMSITVEKDIKQGVTIENDKTLIKILLNNLFQNAIRHNHQGGNIRIKLESGFLFIENTGNQLQIETEQLFERFKKGDMKSKSTGLGLSIVWKICDISQYSIDYSIQDGLHKINLKFGNK